MNDGREFATIIKDHVQVLAIFECSQSLFNTPIEFLRSFAFPSKDTDASSSDTEFNTLLSWLSRTRVNDVRSSGMILSRMDILYTVLSLV